jgi:hypothetical protein
MEEASEMIDQMEVYLDTGEKVSSYSTPSICENPLATNLALCFSLLPSATCLIF